MNDRSSPTTVDAPTGAPSARLRWLAGVCCAWMVIFAGVHVYWALGGSFGMPSGFTVDNNTALLVIDIIAIPLCLGGAVLALALLHPLGRSRPRLTTTLTVLTGVFCVVHAAGQIVANVGMLLGMVAAPESEADRISYFLFEPWWLLGGLLFLFAAWAFHSDRRRVRV